MVIEEGTMESQNVQRTIRFYDFELGVLIIISSDRVIIVKLGFNLFSRSFFFSSVCFVVMPGH